MKTTVSRRSASTSRLHSVTVLVIWVLSVMIVGASAGLLFPPGDWYDTLLKPTWNPPGAVFGPVWTVLYILMGISAWLVWREPGVPAVDRRGAWWAFGVHAVFNLAWTPLFFGFEQPGLALIDIWLVWIALLWLTLRFGRVRPLAGYLLLPQVLWVSFALVLNGTIWLMNT